MDSDPGAISGTQTPWAVKALHVAAYQNFGPLTVSSSRRLIMARLGMVRVMLFVSRGCAPRQSQQGFHLLVCQDWNKSFDVCTLLKLVRSGAQNLFDFGYWIRELFSQILHDDLPLRWLAFERGSLFQQI